MNGPARYVHRKDCPLCGSVALRPAGKKVCGYLAKFNRFAAARGEAAPFPETTLFVTLCGGCGLAFLDPRLDDDGLAAFYGFWYGHEYARVFEPRHAAERIEAFRRFHVPFLEEECRRAALTAGARRPRLLDVGCGTGLFLEALGGERFERAGVESHPEAAAEAARRTGVPVACAPFDDRLFPEESFDVVTMFDLLEHVTDPVGAMRTASRLVRPGGILVARVPDLGSPQARLFFPGWCAILAVHLYYFDINTIARLLSCGGFSLARATNRSGEGAARRLATKAAALLGKVRGRLSRSIRRNDAAGGPRADYADAATPLHARSIAAWLRAEAEDLFDIAAGALGRSNMVTFSALRCPGGGKP